MHLIKTEVGFLVLLVKEIVKKGLARFKTGFYAGVVHQDLHTSVSLKDFANALLYAFAGTDIYSQRQHIICILSALIGYLFKFFQMTSEEHSLCAAFCKLDCLCLADAAAGSGYDRYATVKSIFQILCHVNFPFLLVFHSFINEALRHLLREQLAARLCLCM